jgi:hypothetical protein
VPADRRHLADVLDENVRLSDGLRKSSRHLLGRARSAAGVPFEQQSPPRSCTGDQDETARGRGSSGTTHRKS